MYKSPHTLPHLSIPPPFNKHTQKREKALGRCSSLRNVSEVTPQTVPRPCPLLIVP